MATDKTVNILAADIGGTSSRFGHFKATGDVLEFVGSEWLETGAATSFAQLLHNLTNSGISLLPSQADIFSIAIAGPVERGNFSKPPLIPWTVDLSKPDLLGVGKFILINDFLAQAYACISPLASSAVRILTGNDEQGAAKAVIGAGTGLGKAILLPAGGRGYVAGPSEGGHVNFAPENDREFEFQKFACASLEADYLTWNDVVCGSGLSLIHQFLTGAKLEPAEVAERFGDSPETLEWGAKFYGRVARNFALEVLALSGVYIAGGVAAKNPALVQHRGFEQEFRRSRKHRELLAKIPVHLLSDQQSGLWGAAFAGWRQLV